MYKISLKETIGVYTGIIGIGLISNVLTPLMACGIPRVKNVLGLKIKKVTVERFDGEESEFEEDVGCPPGIDIKYDLETITVYKGSSVLNSCTLNRSSKDMKPYSFGFDNGGSGALGIMLLGIPGFVLSLPVIATCQLMWYSVFKLTDMDVNYYLFWRRIKDQLPPDARVALREALIKASYDERNLLQHEG